MRPTLPSYALVLAVLAVAACRSAPEPKAEVAAPKEAPPEPLQIVGLAPDAQTLHGLTLRLSGRLGPGEAARQISWVVRHGDDELGRGTSDIAPAGDGAFEAALPVTFGDSLEAIAPYQGAETLEVVVEATLKNGAAEVARSRAVRVRSPLVPVAEILSVQASRTGPEAVGLTYLFSVRNPNAFEVRVGTLKYTAFVDGRSIASTSIPLGAKVPPSAENTFEIPAEANAENMGKDLAPMLRKTDVSWAFTGTVKVGGLDVPFDLQGTMKLSK